MYGGKKNLIYEKGTAIIKEYVLADEPNLKMRPKMEDSKYLEIFEIYKSRLYLERQYIK
jgi:hypothetical protein